MNPRHRLPSFCCTCMWYPTETMLRCNVSQYVQLHCMHRWSTHTLQCVICSCPITGFINTYVKWSVGLQRAAHSGTRQPEVHSDCGTDLSHCCRHCACCSSCRKCSGESPGHKVACTVYDVRLCHACTILFDQALCWMQKMPLQQQHWERSEVVSTRMFPPEQVKKVRQASWMSVSQDLLHRLS